MKTPTAKISFRNRQAIFTVVVAAFVAGCGQEDYSQKAGAEDRRLGDGSGDAVSGGAGAGGSRQGDAPTADSAQSPTEDGGSGSAGQGKDPATGGTTMALTGKQFFLQTVSPMFTAQCATCHADPRENPPLRGPLTIFSYTTMRALVVQGATGAESGLIQKMRGFVAHGGGDRCHDLGLDASPCKEVLAWRVIESGADNGLVAELTAVDATGALRGFAALSTQPKAALTVKIYADGGRAKGENPVLMLTADESGANGGIAGAHAFSGHLPASLCDGKPHALDVTTEIGGEEAPLSAARTMTAYTPTAAGKKFFTEQVAPAMEGKCSACHLVNYTTQYGALITPSPALGGSATDNSLINHPSGAVTHAGGNVCGGASGSPCNLFQQWWALEFP